MANYTYNETDYAGSDSWIDKLEHVNPTSSASSEYIDIHFTKPKEATVSALTHPHVTFDWGKGTKTRWYIWNTAGQWTFKVTGNQGKDQKGIADKVLDDALSLNWIRPAQTAKLIDSDGWTTVETKRTKEKRMQTTF